MKEYALKAVRGRVFYAENQLPALRAVLAWLANAVEQEASIILHTIKFEEGEEGENIATVFYEES